MMSQKLKIVVFPFLQPDADRHNNLRQWDLWGPLLICILLSFVLTIRDTDNTDKKFSLIFCVMWIGSAVVTVNAQLLKAHVTTFQLMCTLGYSTFPLLIAALVQTILGDNLVLLQWALNIPMTAWCI
mmetsp:Transcript_84996/g.183257  ORF Transcript_84996/g.183257 Transcript_84996/m.183257 type:complete len:127 (+) Transcript_84996:151-531(+)